MARGSLVNASGATDPGRQREVNEDRFHVDVDRGIFIVVDGVGGQAAGGKAADTALAMLRARLERETGAVTDRVREAITIANDEIFSIASTRPQWHGMACVLTVAVLDGARAIVGHVGDTRLYKVRAGAIAKMTRDHSPVGEREDTGDLTEAEAMKHPRRNEVYRDVGSEAHTVDEPGFIDIYEMPFEPDAALLLCSDGLTDLIDAAAITQIILANAGHPSETVRALVAAANAAGGRDNVTAVVVEGPRFASAVASSEAGTRATRRPGHRVLDIALGALLMALTVAAILALDRIYPLVPALAPFTGDPPMARSSTTTVVHPGESISAALARADSGSTIVVEAGVYQEAISLVSGVRLVSRIPHGATIRRPPDAVDGPVVAADDVTGAELVGFLIAGESTAPLGTGIRVARSDVSIVDVEVTGAAAVGIDINAQSRVSLLGCDLHDNRGLAVAIRSGASARIAHNTFARNGVSNRALLIEPPSEPEFSKNVFKGVNADVFAALGDAARTELSKTNLFLEPPPQPPAAASGARGRRGPG